MDFSLFDFGLDEDYYDDDNNVNSSSLPHDNFGETATVNSSAIPTAPVVPDSGISQAPVGQKSAMRCETCGSTSFHKNGGTYVCRVCGTQTQHYANAISEAEWTDPGALSITQRIIGTSNDTVLKDKTFRESKTTHFVDAVRRCLEAHLDVMVDPNGPIASPPQLRDIVLELYNVWAEKQYIQITLSTQRTQHTQSHISNSFFFYLIRPMKNNILRTKHQRNWFVQSNKNQFTRFNTTQLSSTEDHKARAKREHQERLRRLRNPRLRIMTPAGRLIRTHLNPFLSVISEPLGQRSKAFLRSRGLPECHITVPRNTWGLSTEAYVLPLAFCYLGSLWLRLPYSAADFIRWGMSGVLPTYSAFTYLPLRSVYRGLLKPRRPVTKRTVITVAEGVAREVAFEYPAPNHPFQIARYVGGLRLPHAVAQRACRVWELLPFLDTTSDLVVIAVIVVAMKLSFSGWDGTPTHIAPSQSIPTQNETPCFLQAWVDAWEHYWPQNTPWMNSV